MKRIPGADANGVNHTSLGQSPRNPAAKQIRAPTARFNRFYFAVSLFLANLLAPIAQAQPTPGCALGLDGIDDVMTVGAAPLPTPWTAEFWVKRLDAFDNSA